MKAIIMAGGEGSRLRPLTCGICKPMAPIMNKPMMEHIINLLKKHGITEIAVTTAYMSESIRSYFYDGTAFGVQLQYFEETTPLGTAGSVKNVEEFVDDDFLVISGDSLTDIDLRQSIEFHKATSAVATLILTHVEIPLEYGVVVTDPSGRITRFLEKPGWSEVFSDTVNTGIYVLNKEILSRIPKDTFFDFSKDLFPVLLSEGAPLFGHITDKYWCDIGDLDVYRHCHYDIFDKKLELPINAREISPMIFLEDGAVIEEGAMVYAPALIGKNSVIKTGATVEGYSVIGHNTVVSSGASIKRSVCWNGVNIGKNAQLRGSVVCTGAQIGSDCAVFEQSVLGDNAFLGEGAVIKPGIKIWPHKNIAPNAVVYSNLIWGSGHTRKLFGSRGINGEVNVDITPEFASRLGAAFGSMGMHKIGVAHDGLAASHMLKMGLLGGLQSSGTTVYDLGEQPLPVTRLGTRYYGLDGAVQVGVHNSGGNHRVFLDFLDHNGANIARSMERSLEGIFVREDFKRSESQDIKPITDAPDYKAHYLKGLTSSVRTSPIGLRIVAAVSTEWARQILATVAYELGFECVLITGTVDRRELAKNVQRGGFALGAMIDSGMEELILIDDNGRMIDENMYCALCALMTCMEHKNACIAAKASWPMVIEEIAKSYGGYVKRTKEATTEFMATLTQSASADMRKQFLLHFDAVGALIGILDFLKYNMVDLSHIVDEIPKFYMTKREVECGNSNKGFVIRSLLAQNQDMDLSMQDGVRLSNQNGWVLVLPDAGRPVFTVVSQGRDEEYAKELCDDFTEKIKHIIEQEVKS